jgi:hypothetical protein
MTKQSKKITIISVLILIITSVLGYLTYNPIFKEAPEVIYRDTYFVNTNSDCKGDRTMYCIPKDRRYEAVKLEDNWKHPLSPIVSIVMNENKDPNGTFNNTNVLVVYLKRDSIFDQSFEVDKYRYNAIGKIGYEKTIELIKKQDIYKNNPDPENIRNVPPLTPQEIENNRKLREQKEQQVQTQKDLQAQYDKETPDERGKRYCESIPVIQERMSKFEKGEFIEPNYIELAYKVDKQTLVEIIPTCNEYKARNNIQ